MPAQQVVYEYMLRFIVSNEVRAKVISIGFNNTNNVHPCPAFAQARAPAHVQPLSPTVVMAQVSAQEFLQATDLAL